MASGWEQLAGVKRVRSFLLVAVVKWAAVVTATEGQAVRMWRQVGLRLHWCCFRRNG